MWATAVRGQTVRFWFPLLDTSGVAITGATLPIRVVHEFAPTTALATGNATAADGTNLPGLYYFEYAISASEVYGNIFARANASAISNVSQQQLFAGYYVSEKLALVDAAITTRLAPTVSLRTLDVTATGEAGIDWSNVGAPTTTLNLSGTTIKTVTDVAAAIPSAATVADAVWDEATSGHATAGTTGAMLTNIDATATATFGQLLTLKNNVEDTLTDGMSAADSLPVMLRALAGVDTSTSMASAGFDRTLHGLKPIRVELNTVPTAAENTDSLLDELLAGHTVSGSVAAAITASGSAADPLTNQVPGNYAGGTAGDALGRLGHGNVRLVAPVSLPDGNIAQIIAGDAYTLANGRSLSWTSGDWSTLGLTGGGVTVTLNARAKDSPELLWEIAMTVVSATIVRAELSSADTAKLTRPGTRQYLFSIEATLADTDDSPVTLKSGFIEQVIDRIA